MEIIIIIAVILVVLAVLSWIDSKQKAKREEEVEIDYSVYHLSVIERIRYSVMAGLFLFLVGYLFYRSIILSLILSLLGIFYPAIKRKQLIEKRKSKLQLEFKDALAVIYTSISAGTSPTNAIIGAKDELQRLYFEGEHDIIKEFERMRQKIQFNERVEDVLRNFSDRSGLEDVANFTDVFVMSMNTGGKQVEIIKSTINTIVEKIEIKREIETMVAEKKFEAKVMNAMPFLIMAGLSLSAGDYMEPLFTTLMGRIVITIVLVLLGVAYAVSQKIMRIEV
ncbi:MAG: type II secretion system F family protein [Eubacteriales bacterium]|nr:type II secretion system F family protein [Eubacteriales bacterium]